MATATQTAKTFKLGGELEIERLGMQASSIAVVKFESRHKR
jgi:hypothetical protein